MMTDFTPIDITDLPSAEAALTRDHVVPVAVNGKAGKSSIGKILSLSTEMMAKLYTTMFVDVPVASATNIALRSEEFDNAAWTKSNVTVAANAVVAPDGMLTMDKIVKANGQSIGYVSQIVAQSFGKRGVFSFFAKVGEIKQVAGFLSAGALPAIQQVIFDLAKGEVANGSAFDAGVEDWGNGIYRCYIVTSLTIAAGSTELRIYPASDGAINLPSGNGVDGVYVWGAQFEEASKLGPYAKTIAAAATVNVYSAMHYAAKATSSVGPAIRDSANKSAMLDADRLGLWDTASAVLSYITLTQLIARIFQTSRKIANGYFLSSFRIWDATANTKGLAFDLTSVTAGQTRTIKIPDADVNLSQIGYTESNLTLSGAALDFTGIAADVNKITIIIGPATTSANTNLLIQLGTATGIDTSTNYSGVASAISSSPGSAAFTTGFRIGAGSGSTTFPSHHIVLERAAGNTWLLAASGSDTASRDLKADGTIALAAALTQFRVTTVSGTATMTGTMRVKLER